MKPTVQMVDKMSKGDPEIAGYFHALFGIIDQQAERIQHLEARVVELERQLGQNSSNSSKPPSSDLQESWKLARAARMEGTSLQPEVIQAVSEWYDTILERGAAEWTSKAAKQPKATGGKRKKSKAENLAIRFRLYKDNVLRFSHDARIPFDNNQAERDLRMVKVKQKVSGAFRTVTGAERFARLRGFISTCLKQNIPVLASLTDATRGQFLFQTT